MGNRAIKFRAWDKANNEMFMVGTLQWDAHYDLTLPSICDEVMQYTGLLDKNGKEIFEGDILNNGNKTAYVFWNSDYQAFWVRYDGEKLGEQYYDSMSYFCTGEDEVLGNIYSNPELLTDGKD